MNCINRITSSLLAAVLVAAPAAAGPDIIENEDCGNCAAACDAGSLPATACSAPGSGPIDSISGAMTGTPLTGDADFEDMYLIRIDDPAIFRASTSMQFGGNAEFNTQLFLLDAEGLGLLANDDDPNDPLGGSLLLPVADDGTMQTIPAPGLYYLAITGFNNDPQGHEPGTGNPLPIFFQESRFEISGPDGPGGQFPIGSWSEQGEIGSYVITLEGVSFAESGPPEVVPANSNIATILLVGFTFVAAVIVLRSRRARAA